MKSPRKLRNPLLWLLAVVVMTTTFRMAMTSRTAHSKPMRHATYDSRIERQPSAHLVEAALRKTDFPQMLTASEKAALHLPILTPNGITLIPDHSLMVEAIPVVEDPNLTWDPCLALNGGNGGTKTGAWTFNELMLAVAGTTDSNPQPAEQILTNIIADFAQDVKIGSTFTAFHRHLGREFFNSWPVDQNDLGQCSNPFNSGQCLSLLNAPVHLNAIVNRVDIGQNGSSDNAGQLRFVFGVTMDPLNDDPHHDFCEGSNGSGDGDQSFNIILEYNVPPSSYTAQSWAQAWLNLSNLCPEPAGFTTQCAQQGIPPNPPFNSQLNQIVQNVVALGAGGPNVPNGSALFDIRTNETELDGAGATWELRQFLFAQSSGSGVLLVQTGLSQTPDLSFDFGGPPGSPFCKRSLQTPACSTSPGTVESLVQNNQSQIEDGTFNAGSDQAASALNFTVDWDSSPSMSADGLLYTPRVIFAASPQVFNPLTRAPDAFGGIDGTCNGCHGAETQTAFRHVVNRKATGTGDAPSALSAFLVGCTNNSPPLTSVCATPSLLNFPGNEVVQDLVYGSTGGSFNNTFGDIQRRVNCMNTILNNPPGVQCNGAGLAP